MWLPIELINQYEGAKTIRRRDRVVSIWCGGRLIKEVKYKDIAGAKKMAKYYAERLM